MMPNKGISESWHIFLSSSCGADAADGPMLPRVRVGESAAGSGDRRGFEVGPTCMEIHQIWTERADSFLSIILPA